MNVQHHKNLIVTALALAMGTGMQVASADTIASWNLGDFNSDGLKSDFAFFSAPPGNGPNAFGATVETGCSNAIDNNNCDPIAFDAGTIPSLVFSTGFNFGGTGLFEPNITADRTFTTGSASGQIDIDKAGGLTLTFSALDFAGRFPADSTSPVQFLLGPDSLAPGNGTFGNGTNTVVTRLGVNSFGAVVRYVGTIDEPGNAFDNFQANWRIEGIMSVTDASPVVFINGNPGGDLSGDTTVNEAPNIPYVDQGAVCQDVVDGEITGAALTTAINNPNAPNTGPDGSLFTVEYQCTDSQSQTTTVTKTVEVGNDTTPPVVTLGVGAPEIGRIDTLGGATVNILVGVPYVDAGATCTDNRDGTIALGSVTPPFTVTPDPAVINTATPSTGNTITFSCDDTVGNGPTVAVRTVNVVADNQAPVISLNGANPLTVAVGSTVLDPGATCADTNPVDAGSVDISANLNVSPADPTGINTSAPGSTTITYNCSDASGNAAVQQTRTVNIVAGQNFQIQSMTISDVDGDGIVGCFKFNSLDSTTCSGANRFSSDGSAATGFAEFSNTTIPGMGTDLDGNGNPIGIRFGSFQPIINTLNPGFGGLPQPVGLISPGFMFTGFPFVPLTFDPPSEAATPPSGYVTTTGAGGILTIESLPFSGLYNSNKANTFFLDPDDGTLTATILQDNNDDNGTTRTFNYFMTWSHVITAAEDPTNAFVNFNAFWRLEGVITVDSTPFVVNNPPVITSMSAAQDSRAPTTIIVATGGLVTVTAVASDPDAANSISYDWSQSSVTAVGATDQATFTFNPSSLADGPVALTVVVTDDAATPASAQAELILNATAIAPVLSTANDADGDGIDDATEGFGDTDNDGIPDYQDPINGISEPTRNRVDFRTPSRGDIVTSAGQLRLGRVTTAVSNGSFVATESDIANFGGAGATPTSNYHDRLNDVSGIGPISGGIRDFKVTGLQPGETVQIVIPQDQPLPVLPEYRKYNPQNGWVPFARISGNAVASAKKVGGVCPGPSDSAYDAPIDSNGQTIMVEGDECVRLTIVDGGANDSDFTRNGTVVDPGTVSSNGPVSGRSASSGGGCTLRAGVDLANKGDLWLWVLALFGLFTFNSVHKRNAE